jgi:hypothetical protein
MKEKKPEQNMKSLTVEDLAKVVGGAAASEDESPGGEIEYTQRKSKYPESKTTISTSGGGILVFRS